MTTREIVKKLCKENKVSLNKIEHELGFGSGYISKLWNFQTTKKRQTCKTAHLPPIE